MVRAGFHISTGNNSTMFVQAAHSTSKSAHTLRALSASIRVDWLFTSSMLFGSDAATTIRLNQRGFYGQSVLPVGWHQVNRLQVSMCLPNDRDLDTWYEAVYALPIAWPDVTDLLESVWNQKKPVTICVSYVSSWSTCIILIPEKIAVKNKEKPDLVYKLQKVK